MILWVVMWSSPWRANKCQVHWLQNMGWFYTICQILRLQNYFLSIQPPKNSCFCNWVIRERIRKSYFPETLLPLLKMDLMKSRWSPTIIVLFFGSTGNSFKLLKTHPQLWLEKWDWKSWFKKQASRRYLNLIICLFAHNSRTTHNWKWGWKIMPVLNWHYLLWIGSGSNVIINLSDS